MTMEDAIIRGEMSGAIDDAVELLRNKNVDHSSTNNIVGLIAVAIFEERMRYLHLMGK